MKTLYKNYFLLFIILLIAAFLRFNQLGVNPPSLDWDETSIGYNAYSILKTGRDEYGTKFPASFRSFDDYKPPLYVYLTVPSIAFFGLNEFSVRLPSAILGTLSVVALYFLVKEILSKWDEKKERIALFSSFLFAISPWSLQFSRAAFEANIGLFFLLSGLLFFFKAINKNKLYLFLISGVSFVLCMYSYHSFRLVVPFLGVSLAFLFWKDLLKQKKQVLAAIAVSAVLSFPIFFSFFSSIGASSRLSMVSIFDSNNILENSIKDIEYDRERRDYLGSFLHNRRVVYFLSVAKGYFDQWNPDFLFFHGDGGRQHHAVDMGMQYLWEFPFIIGGAYALFRRRNREIWTLLALFLIALIPSSITTGTPHPVRAIAMAPILSIFAGVGVYFIFIKVKNLQNRLLFLGLSFIILFAFVLNLYYYLHQYYVHTSIKYGDFWQYGHKETFAEVSKIEDEFNRIIVTYKYDQPYIYYLFHNKIDPAWYQKNWDYLGTGEVERMRRIIGKYEFRNINWETDRNLENTLLIASPEEVPDNAKIFKKIEFPDGSTAFVFIKT